MFDKVFIVAELSANHNGNIDIAIETIKAAKRAGADAIKLQSYTPDTITINSKKEDFLIKGTVWNNKFLYDLYKMAHTPFEWHSKLFEVAESEGLVCFSSPFDIKSVDLLETLETPFYKIASPEISDIPLIKYVASKGKPIIISTGIATKEDISLCLDTIRKEGNDQIVLLKCVSSYPAPVEESNLIMIQEYKREFNVLAGLSDHTLSNLSSIAAVSLGACMIEKHIILEKSLGGPDASFSLDEKEFKSLVDSIRMTELALGKKDYKLTNSQLKSKKYSRSLYIVKDVIKGEVVTIENIRSIRPGYGLHPKFYSKVLGKKFINSFEKGTRLKLEYIDHNF